MALFFIVSAVIYISLFLFIGNLLNSKNFINVKPTQITMPQEKVITKRKKIEVKSSHNKTRELW